MSDTGSIKSEACYCFSVSEDCFHFKVSEAIGSGGSACHFTASDMEMQDVHGETALHVAARWEAPFSLLLQLLDLAPCGVVNAQNLRGQTFMHLLPASVWWSGVRMTELGQLLRKLEECHFKFDNRDASGKDCLAAALAQEAKVPLSFDHSENRLFALITLLDSQNFLATQFLNRPENICTVIYLRDFLLHEAQLRDCEGSSRSHYASIFRHIAASVHAFCASPPNEALDCV
jgi:hypothetical protein